MEREYVKDGNVHFRVSARCTSFVGYAKDYVKEDRKIISKVDKKVRDAVLIDSINYFGLMNGCDFPLNTNALYNTKRYPIKVDAWSLLISLERAYANYIFEEGIVDSVLLNCNTNACREKFDENDGILVLLDFMNYISERNNLDKVFTLKELYENSLIQKHIRETNELRSFLKHSGEYYERMQSGESIESIYEQMCIATDLKNISSTGTYNYSDEAMKKYGRRVMYPWDKRTVEKELYAMAYAYAKLYGGNKHTLKIQAVKQKIREMQGR